MGFCNCCGVERDPRGYIEHDRECMFRECKRCFGEMGIGQAIKTPNYPENSLRGIEGKINSHTLELIHVWKCKSCGNSEDLNENN